jgi:hypothetical protein
MDLKCIPQRVNPDPALKRGALGPFGFIVFIPVKITGLSAGRGKDFYQ